jgi:uncharacterized protein YjaG (DUF416 family)
MTPTFRFDQVELTSKLDQLPPKLRVIFAGSCAERALPAYVTSSGLTGWGDPEMLTRILSRLWEDTAGERMTESEVQKNINICMDLIPQDYHEPWYVEQACAEDAATAVVYALTCRQDDNSQEAMWSAQCACEAAGYFATNREGIDLKPGAASRVFDHPLIQAELARQLRDIDELLRVGDEDVRQVAARFRDRAKAESKIFFGVPS